MQKPHILIIDDEDGIRDMLRFALSKDFQIYEAADIQKAKKQLKLEQVDLIILDWMLPNISGIDFLKQLRADVDQLDIPVIMLTARAEEENKIRGLNSGADDFITKPFSPKELIARINSILRRGRIKAVDNHIFLDPFKLNLDNKTVSINNTNISLTAIEFSMLHFFITHPNKIYSRDQLITRVWGAQKFIDERTVDVQIRRLRDKLREHQLHHCIKTVRNAGYEFVYTT